MKGGIGLDRPQRGDGGIALSGVHLGLGQLQRGQVAIDPVLAAQRGDRRFGLLQIVGGNAVDRLLVIQVGLLVLLLAVLLPPLAAENHRQSQRDATNQSGAIVPQPTADAFALFVLVEQIINRHAYSRPVRAGS